MVEFQPVDVLAVTCSDPKSFGLHLHAAGVFHPFGVLTYQISSELPGRNLNRHGL
jgi:hypothetical protein